ncbi:hypothetical protein Ahy_A05g024775 isoform B [Arachis hypogaea]|uniref:Uncharacterized protein n=1 Tax=Arachis hypogaea TaxID=3818 RepID=A0A445D6N3_ARAHY|nr:hypothetical protein Ahy_A05g024775 isoform B [Arachis hypogaea]
MKRFQCEFYKVSIQVYVPLSQTIHVPEIEPSPTKSEREKISEERTKKVRNNIGVTPQPPKPDESTPTVPPVPYKIPRRRCYIDDDSPNSILHS